jgi:hypothetical protein
MAHPWPRRAIGPAQATTISYDAHQGFSGSVGHRDDGVYRSAEAAPQSTNTPRTPQNPVDDDLYGRLWIAAFRTRASCNQPGRCPGTGRPARWLLGATADLYQVTEAVLERPEELSKCWANPSGHGSIFCPSRTRPGRILSLRERLASAVPPW